MAKELKPARYTAPPAPRISTNVGDGSAIAKAIGVGIDIHDKSKTGKAVADADAAVQSVFDEAKATSVDHDELRPYDMQMSPLEFAEQTQRLRDSIQNTKGSSGLALLRAKQVFQNHMDNAGPRVRRKLMQEYSAFVNSDPEIQELASMADAAASSANADYLAGIDELSYKPFKDGGYGISRDIPLGSEEWARQFGIQKAKRATLDANIEKALILTAQGALDGPKALQVTADILQSESGLMQGLFNGYVNRLKEVTKARIGGQFDPQSQLDWEEEKKLMLYEIDMQAANIGQTVEQYWQKNPSARNDRESWNEAQDMINQAQADAITLRNALANDDFSVIQAMEDQTYLRGRRRIADVPELEAVMEIMAVQPTIFTGMRDAGITGDKKFLQTEFEEDFTNAQRKLYRGIFEASGDDLDGGGTTEAPDPEDYVEKRKKAKRALKPDVREPATIVRDSKELIDTVAETLLDENFNFTSTSEVSKGLLMFGESMSQLTNVKEYLFHGGDLGKIRESFGQPALKDLFLAAVKLNVPGLDYEATQFDNYMRETSDEDDLDSWSRYKSDLEEQASKRVTSLPLVENILEVVYPVPFNEIQNKGTVVYRVDEKKVETAVRASLAQRGADLKEASIISQVNQAVRFAKRDAQLLSTSVTTALNARHNHLILVNRLTDADYLQALLDPDFGLGDLVPLDENIVYNDR